MIPTTEGKKAGIISRRHLLIIGFGKVDIPESICTGLAKVFQALTSNRTSVNHAAQITILLLSSFSCNMN